MANSATFTFGYTGTNFTRQYELENVPDDQLPQIKDRVLAMNASLQAGTAGGLSSFFISDDYNALAGIGEFSGITEAQYKVSNYTPIFGDA